MNFYDKKVRKIMAITIMVIIIAMVATSVIPYLVQRGLIMQKTTQDRKRKMNAKEKQRLLVVAGIIVFSILIVFGILYFVFRSRVMSTADNEIYNNVYVETVDVSGMKKAEAKKAVEAKIKKYQEQSISLHIEEENVQVTLGEIGFAIKDVDGLVEKALNYGKDGSIWSRYFSSSI